MISGEWSMFSRVKAFFQTHFGAAEQDEQGKAHELRLAAATLCVEVMRADYAIEEAELREAIALFRAAFALDETEARDLLLLAEDSANDAASLHPFTSLLNAEYSLEQKISVVEMLWRIVLADNDKDKYEEHLVRKVAELLYLPHTAFIQARHRAEAHYARGD